MIDAQKLKRKELKHTTTKKCNYKGRQQDKTVLKSSQKTVNKMVIVSSYLSVITLNINGLNSPVKRHRGAEWVKQISYSMLSMSH